MRIEQIELEGFKSYSTKTTIGLFHPQFNAITGLNGTGKSNILDSICFALGITNLSQIRANNLQDLIYKQGQGGINKATVTIRFNNEDKKQSPPGYEQHKEIEITRQIILGGRNKFLINGKNATNQQIQDFFSSIQLNINNPTFVIMQGRIMRIINAKPLELLSLVEECAGTNMFGAKKSSCVGLLERKDEQLRRVDEILTGEIRPSFEKLTAANSSFEEYGRNEVLMREMEERGMVLEWERGEREREEREERWGDVCGEMEKLEEEERERREEREREKERERVGRKEMEGMGGEEGLEGLRKKEGEERRECGERKRKWEYRVWERGEVERRMEKGKDRLEGKKGEREQMRGEEGGEVMGLVGEVERRRERGRLIRECEQAVGAGADLESIERLLEGGETSADKAAEENLMKPVQQRLVEMANELGRMKGEVEGRRREERGERERLGRLEKALKENEASLKVFDELGEERERRRGEVEKVKAVFDVSKYEECERRLERLIHEIDQNLMKQDKVRRHLPPETFFRLDKDECQNLIRDVFGTVCEQLSWMESETGQEFARPMETAVKSRLLNIIVRTDETANKIIERGYANNRRLTFLPLNKLLANTLSKETKREILEFVHDDAGRPIGERQVIFGMDILEFAANVRKAIEFVFGRLIICRDAKTASKITFDMHQKLKTVTIEGDVYDAGGIVTGGSSGRENGAMFLHAMEWGALRLEWTQLEGEKREIEAYLEREDIKKWYGEYQFLTRELVQVEKRLQILMGEGTKGGETGTLAMRRERDETLENLKRLEGEVKNLMSRIGEIEKEEEILTTKLNREKKERQKFLTRLREMEKKEREKLEEAEHQIKQHQKAIQQRERAQELLDATIRELEEQLVADEKLSAEILADVSILETAWKESETRLAECEKELRAESVKFDALQSKLDQSVQTIENLTNLIKSIENQKIAKEKERQRLATETAEAKARCAQLRKRLDHANVRIPDENSPPETANVSEHKGKRKRGAIEKKGDEERVEEKRGEERRGEKRTSEQISAELLELEEKKGALVRTQENLRKKFNSKNLMKMAELTATMEKLTEKRDVIKQEKLMILRSMEELESKKKKFLMEIFHKINENFSSIFNSILPNANARLVPAGDTIFDGITFDVSFQNIKKKNLSELSGGQKSLLALSFVLALLKLNPSPIYIFDEIDSALDVSHTSNIGRMIKRNFPFSQFIIVSLKDQMFQNADVLFSTRFENNVSKVIRTQNAPN